MEHCKETGCKILSALVIGVPSDFSEVAEPMERGPNHG